MALANFFSGQYAEARVSIDKALAEWPTSTPALQDKAAICGLMGQIEEGGSCVQQLLASNPRWNVSAVRSQFEPRLRKHPRGLESYLRGLRQSGLPEGDAS
jgi:hypothetical protein